MKLVVNLGSGIGGVLGRLSQAMGREAHLIEDPLAQGSHMCKDTRAQFVPIKL